jgi:hypothetical protein
VNVKRATPRTLLLKQLVEARSTDPSDTTSVLTLIEFLGRNIAKSTRALAVVQVRGDAALNTLVHDLEDETTVENLRLEEGGDISYCGGRR